MAFHCLVQMRCWQFGFPATGSLVSALTGEVPIRPVREALIRQVKFVGKKRRIRQAQTELSKKSLELGVFGLGLLEDGDIGVGVFP
jgi:hypothetical protein